RFLPGRPLPVGLRRGAVDIGLHVPLVSLRLLLKRSQFLRGRLQFADSLLHLLARLEGDDELRRDGDRLPTVRVARLALLAETDLEDTEVAQFDAAILDQSVDDRIE